MDDALQMVRVKAYFPEGSFVHRITEVRVGVSAAHGTPAFVLKGD